MVGPNGAVVAKQAAVHRAGLLGCCIGVLAVGADVRTGDVRGLRMLATAARLARGQARRCSAASYYGGKP